MKYHPGFVLLLLTTIVSCSDKRESYKPKLTDLSESVYASGKIKAVNQFILYPTVSGTLTNIIVKAGDVINKGQVLFEIENTTSGLASENARLALELSQQNSNKNSDKLQEIELSLKQAYDKMKLDSSIYRRQKNLWEQKIGNEIELEQKKLAYKSSLANYQIIQKRLNQLKIQLANESKRAGISYDISRKNLTDFSVTSSASGKIYDILKEKGELISPQTPLAVIGAADSFIVELEINEVDITRVKIGQTVLITLDSYKGQVFEAIVKTISPLMNEKSRNFILEASFIKPPPNLYPNLTAEANIVIRTKINALTIPTSFLVDENEVWISKKEKRKITTGLRDFDNVEVLEGLTEKDIIYKPE